MLTEQDVFIKQVFLSGATKSKPGKMTKSYILTTPVGTRPPCFEEVSMRPFKGVVISIYVSCWWLRLRDVIFPSLELSPSKANEQDWSSLWKDEVYILIKNQNQLLYNLWTYHFNPASILNVQEYVWDFQNINGHVEAHLQISRMTWQLLKKISKFAFSEKFGKL